MSVVAFHVVYSICLLFTLYFTECSLSNKLIFINTIVWNLSDGNSLDDVYEVYGGIRYIENIIEVLAGKTDSVLKLASSVYQLAMSAEEHGLFMLNWKYLLYTSFRRFETTIRIWFMHVTILSPFLHDQ